MELLEEEKYELVKTIKNMLRVTQQLALDYVKDDDLDKCKQTLEIYEETSVELLKMKMGGKYGY